DYQSGQLLFGLLVRTLRLRDVSFKKGNAVFMLGFELCAGIRINIDSYDFGSTLSQHFRYRATNTGSATCNDADFIFELHTWLLSWFYRCYRIRTRPATKKPDSSSVLILFQ